MPWRCMQAIPGGQLQLSVMWRGWRVHTETMDLCASTACPIAAGPLTIANTQRLPSIAPPGQYSIRLEASGGGGAAGSNPSLMCIQMHFDIQHQDRRSGDIMASIWRRWMHGRQAAGGAAAGV